MSAERLQIGDKVSWTVWDRHNGQLKTLYHWGTINHLASKTVQIHCEDGKNRKFPKEEVKRWIAAQRFFLPGGTSSKE